MSDETKCLLSAMLCAFMFGVAISYGITSSVWEYRTVQHGAAEYDSKTGRWKWKMQAEQAP